MVQLQLSSMLKQAKLAGVELEGSFNLGRISENLNKFNFGIILLTSTLM